jgi:hypothetical protein
MQGTRVHALGNGRLILPARQTRSSGLSRSTGPFGRLSALPIIATLQPLVLRAALRRTAALPINVAFRTATTLLPRPLIRALG